MLRHIRNHIGHVTRQNQFPSQFINIAFNYWQYFGRNKETISRQRMYAEGQQKM